jgi:[glutamine synthetase] adenylyltransferase / [glutamine synthetase]-adenylyl-L-tyrosine phosphorylase
MRAMSTRPKNPAPLYCGVPTLESPAQQESTPVLFALGLEPAKLESTLRSYGLHRIQDADANLQSMAGDPHERRQLADC